MFCELLVDATPLILTLKKIHIQLDISLVAKYLFIKMFKKYTALDYKIKYMVSYKKK